MLDPAIMVLLGKLKILAKQTGTNIDLVKITGDKDYAELMLKELSNSDDPELVIIVIKLMNHYGMFETTIDAAKSDDKSDNNRYIGTLR